MLYTTEIMNSIFSKVNSIKLPWFPISVIIFFSIITIGDMFGVIPGISDMIAFLQSLYERFGLFGLFVSALLEGVAYFGLYFPGSVVVLLAVALSDGSFASFAAISATVAIALTISSFVSYKLGSVEFIQNKLKVGSEYDKDSLFWFVFNHWHPNGLGLLYFKRGFNGENLFPYIFATPCIIFIYGMFFSSVVFSLKDRAGGDETWIIFIILGLWFLVELYFKNRTVNKSNSIEKV